MKSITAVCASLVGAALFTGGTALSDDRCPPGHAAAGLCAPVVFVDDDRADLLERRAYKRGYRDALSRNRARGYWYREEAAPAPDVAMDGKEGHSLGYENTLRSQRNYDRRRYDRDEYFERRLRRNDAGEVVDFATDLLRGLAD